SLIVIILGLQGITIHRAFEATPDVINITDDSKNIQNNILITNTLTKKPIIQRTLYVYFYQKDM
ncbi:MAG: hypothetical protein ACJ71M_08395, partial [Nitrososphaeraceae archaeon]